jgi:hypothetical protein
MPHTIKGQLRFDKFLDIYEETYVKTDVQTIEQRAPMIDPCYYCQCNSCVNNAESITVKADEVPDDYKPCFLCDECQVFDGNFKNRRIEVTQCERYEIDNYHAEKARKKFKIVR